MRVQEIIDIDGIPYLHRNTLDDLAAYVAEHERRLAALEERVTNGNR